MRRMVLAGCFFLTILGKRRAPRRHEEMPSPRGNEQFVVCSGLDRPGAGLRGVATTNMGGEGIFNKIDAVIWAVIQDHIR